MRAVPAVGRLRRPEVFEAVRLSLRKVGERGDFRVVHFSIQHNHVHLIVEGDTPEALDRGLRGLAVSLARRINAALGRTGRVFAYRYHTTALTSPRQTRNAIAYVLNNWRRHREDERSFEGRTARLDRFSSAVSFDGWANWKLRTWPRGYVPLPVSRPRTWLLSTGWQRGGRRLDVYQTPGPLHD